jgi:hypothetical protein
VCLATSEDGVSWRNVTDQAGGARVVWDRPAFSRSILLDDEAAPAQRWRLLQIENPVAQKAIYPMFYQLYASPDGLTWTRQSADPASNGTGSPEDCSSAMFNPFRNVTVLSSKWTEKDLGRQRKYAEASTFSEDAFDQAPLVSTGGVSWAAADALDPSWLGATVSGGNDHAGGRPELYNLDGVAYESLMLGSFRIFRCKEHYTGCAVMYPNRTECVLHPKNKDCHALSHELADILLGFSRDGFTFSRTPAAQPGGARSGIELSPDRRYPFVGQDIGGPGWNSQGLGSIPGGLAIVGPKTNETLRMFISSEQRELTNTGVAIFRRDG